VIPKSPARAATEREPIEFSPIAALVPPVEEEEELVPPFEEEFEEDAAETVDGTEVPN
jgi:hypothetical protein